MVSSWPLAALDCGSRDIFPIANPFLLFFQQIVTEVYYVPGTIAEGWHILVKKRDKISCHIGTFTPVITGSRKDRSRVYLIVKEVSATCGG